MDRHDAKDAKDAKKENAFCFSSRPWRLGGSIFFDLRTRM
jgi:hypothetical protein